VDVVLEVDPLYPDQNIQRWCHSQSYKRQPVQETIIAPAYRRTGCQNAVKLLRFGKLTALC